MENLNLPKVTIQELSKSILKDALTKGFFILPESGDIRELKASEILMLAKHVLKEGLILDDEVVVEDNTLPVEMFTSTDSTLDSNLFTLDLDED